MISKQRNNSFYYNAIFIGALLEINSWSIKNRFSRFLLKSISKLQPWTLKLWFLMQYGLHDFLWFRESDEKTKLIECPGSDSLVDTTKKRPTANTHCYPPICAKFSRLQIEFWYERYVIQWMSSRFWKNRTHKIWLSRADKVCEKIFYISSEFRK